MKHNPYRNSHHGPGDLYGEPRRYPEAERCCRLRRWIGSLPAKAAAVALVSVGIVLDIAERIRKGAKHG